MAETVFSVIEKTGILDDYKVICFVPKDGTFYALLDKMKARNNGLDTMTCSYIVSQNVIFRMFCSHFPSVEMVEIDVTDQNSWNEAIQRVDERLDQLISNKN